MPLVPDTCDHGFESARAFLCRFDRDDFWFRSALVKEVADDCTAAMSGLSDPELIDAAAHAIATGRTRLVFPMPSTWQARFDRRHSFGNRIDSVFFADRAAATDAVSVLLAARHSAAALEQALHSPAAERGLLTVAPQVARALLGKPAPEPPTWPPAFALSNVDLARLLAHHWLLLRPSGTTGRSFQLAWAIHGGGASEETDPGDADPAPRRPVRPATQEGPRSILPTPPTTLSDQVSALIAAAAAGTPFCEECEAAKLAAAGGSSV